MRTPASAKPAGASRSIPNNAACVAGLRHHRHPAGLVAVEYPAARTHRLLASAAESSPVEILDQSRGSIVPVSAPDARRMTEWERGARDISSPRRRFFRAPRFPVQSRRAERRARPFSL